MPSGEFKPLLERDFSRVAVQPIVALTSPLLQELVNAGLAACRRCEVEAARSEQQDLHIAAFVLFRHVLEMCDGVEVLVSQSCGTAAIPTLRSQLEASLSLHYLLESRADYAQRAFGWLCVNIHEGIEARELLEPGTKAGKVYADMYDQDFAPLRDSSDRASNPGIVKELEGLREMLASPALAPTEAEYRQRSSKSRYPKWFSLFGGPISFQKLAEHLRRGAEFKLLYGDLSRVVHGTDVSRYLDLDKDRTLFEGARRPNELKDIASLSALMSLKAIRQMIEHFREGEKLDPWYRREIKPLFDRLRNLKLNISPIRQE